MTSRLPQQSNADAISYQLHFPSTTDLPALLPQLLTFLTSLSSTYIFHSSSPPSLALSPLSFSAPVHQEQHRYLLGKTDVTDAVDDEWFIVWLLKRLSEEYPECVVKVEDDDGEFLLIEAAEVLPNWVTPQNAENRVWIHRGNLHLVPLTHRSALPFPAAETANPSFDADEEGYLDLTTALELVRDEKVETGASKDVEEAVWARINGYPAKIREHHHHTLSYLPTDVALALSDSPELIAEAVKAFYEREPDTLRACNTMARFPPSAPSAAFSPSPSGAAAADGETEQLPPTVLVSTTLTRPLYSQLLLQRFYAPKPFSKAGWAVSSSSTPGQESDQEELEKRWKDVGMKIACGFEMLYQHTAPQVRRTGEENGVGKEVEKDPKYRAFVKTLQEKGFFAEEIEGSEGWKVKEKAARSGWEKGKGDRPTLSFAQRVDDAIARRRSSPSPLLPSRLLTLPTASSAADLVSTGLEDSDAWMQLDEQGLEDLLSSRGGGGRGGFGGLGESDEDEEDEEDDEEGGDEEMDGGKEETRKAKKAALRLEEMAKQVEGFVEGRGAVQGALFDDERSDDEASDNDDDDAEDSSMAPPPLTAEERAARMDKLVTALPEEEWGQKESAAVPVAATAADELPPLDEMGSAAKTTKSGGAAEKQAVDARTSRLEAEHYDGASDSSGDGESSAGDPDDAMLDDDLEGDDEEDAPAIVGGEDGLDMGEEMDEFLKFATETLGLTEEQYQGILGERRQRGAFVPAPAAPKKTNVLPSKTASSSTSTAKPTPSSTAAAQPSPAAATAAGRPPPPTQQHRNPNLADFDSLMEKMERELASSRTTASSSAKPTASTSTANEDAEPSGARSRAAAAAAKQPFAPNSRVVVDSLTDSEDEDEAEGDAAGMAAMDAELANLLSSSGAGMMGGERGGDGEQAVDYNVVKNFLESFQAQGGFGGPAGNLAGRMGFNLPRDT